MRVFSVRSASTIENSTYSDLGRRVQRKRLFGRVGRGAGRDDDAAGHAVLLHRVPRQLHHVDHAAEVDVHDRVAGLEEPVLRVELVREGVCHFRDPGVGEHHVDLSDAVEDPA